MIALLIKSSVVVAIVLAFYKLVLERESFFSKNRLYLLGCLALTFVLPFITLPQLVPDQGIVSTTIEKINPTEPMDTRGTVLITEDVFEQSEPVEIYKSTEEVNEIEASAGAIPEASVSNTPPPNVPSTAAGMGWAQWLLLIYFFGVIIFALHMFTQIISLVLQIMKSTDRIEDTDSTIINLPAIKEPCSFFNYIFINPETYDYETYEQILAHERIHVKQRHTFDLLLSEIAAIILWFNPLIWFFRKEVEKNIEYQTDDLLLREKAAEKEVYQMNLVRIATYNRPLTVTTNYNQSLIKQRLLKMNSQKSNPHSYWKYAFIAPMIFGILLILNKPNTVFAANNSVSEERTEVIDETAFVENVEATVESNTAITKEETISNNEPLLSEEDRTACSKLESALKKSDINEVKRILMNLDATCFQGATKSDIKVFETIKSIMSDYTDIFINPNTGQIVLKYESTTIYDANLLDHPGYTGRRNFSKGIDVKCDKMLKAEKERDFETLKTLYKNLTADCLKNPKSIDLEHMEYMKFLMRQNANMSIETKTITLNTKEMMSVKHDEKSFNSSISSSDVEYHGSYMEMKNMGVYDKKDVNDSKKNINWTSIENYEILENLDHMIRFKDLPLAEKEVVLNILKNDSETVGLLEDYQILIDDNDLKGEDANEIRAAVDEILSDVIQPSKEVSACKSILKAVTESDASTLKKMLRKNNPNCSCYSKESFRINNTHTATITGNQTPLVNAARIGNVQIGQILMNAGADADYHSDGESSAFAAAKKYGNNDFVSLLKRNDAEVFSQKNEIHPNWEPTYDSNNFFSSSKRKKCKNLVTAIALEEIPKIEQILETVDVNCKCDNSEIFYKSPDGNFNESRSALVAAARTGDTEIGQLLLNHGALIDLRVKGDGTPLIAASKSGNLDFIKLLVKNGADVNKKIKGDGTALIEAARRGHLPIVKYLISKDADVNAVVRGDGTPLICAVRNDHYEVAKYLIERGAKPTLAVPGDENPIYHAKANNNPRMIKLLQQFAMRE